MSKFEVFLFLFFLSHAPSMCQTQLRSELQVLTVTKNVSAMTAATIKSAEIDAQKTKDGIKELTTNLQRNATVIQRRINTVVNNALTTFQSRIESLGINSVDIVLNDCGVPDFFVESAASEILMDAKSCVSNTVESIEKELNETYSTIESTLDKINSEQRLAETCIAEYEKRETRLLGVILTALCVSQTKQQILSTIEDELSTRNDPAFLNRLYTDAMNRLKSCNDGNRISKFLAETEFIYVKIMSCISN